MPQAHDVPGNQQQTPPERSGHAGRLSEGSRTAASQSEPDTGTFDIARRASRAGHLMVS
jgi:hypothetical protein